MEPERGRAEVANVQGDPGLFILLESVVLLETFTLDDGPVQDS